MGNGEGWVGEGMAGWMTVSATIDRTHTITHTSAKVGGWGGCRGICVPLPVFGHCGFLNTLPASPLAWKFKACY